MKLSSKFIANLLSAIIIMSMFATFLPVLSKGLAAPTYLYDNHDFQSYKDAEEKTDILILGNSHARYGIWPHVISDITQKNATVLATGAMNLPWLYHSLEELLQYQVPELIIVESFVYDVRSKNASFTPIARTIYGDNFLKALPAMSTEMDWSQIFYAWSPLIRYHDQWNMALDEFVTTVETDYKTTNPRLDGYVYSITTVAWNRYADYSGTLDPARGLPQEYLEYTEKIIKLGEKYNVPVIFIKMPTVDGYGVYDEAVGNMIEEANGVFYDLNTLYTDHEKFNRIHFFDASGPPINSHLNSLGALKGSVLLSDIAIETLQITVDEEKHAQLSSLFVNHLEIQNLEDDQSFLIKIHMDYPTSDLQYTFDLLNTGKLIESYTNEENYWIVKSGVYKSANQLKITVKNNVNDYKIQFILPTQ